MGNTGLPSRVPIHTYHCFHLTHCPTNYIKIQNFIVPLGPAAVHLCPTGMWVCEYERVLNIFVYLTLDLLTQGNRIRTRLKARRPSQKLHNYSHYHGGYVAT